MKKKIMSRKSLPLTGIGCFFLVFIFLACLASPAWPANYYLSQTGAGTKSGTSPENAWSWVQLSSGWSSIRPGDTLYIIGVYNMAEFRVGASGTENNYVTIAGYGSNSGIDLTYNKSSASFTGPDAYGAYKMSGTVGGQLYGFAEWASATGPFGWTEIANAGKLPDATWKEGMAHYDSANQVIYWKPFGGTISGKTLSVGTSNAFYLNGHKWVKVTNLKIYGGRVNLSGQSSYVWLDHLTVDGLRGGILMQFFDCHHVRLSHSTIKNGVDGLWNMGGDDDYITIDHNVFTDFRGGNDSHCIGFYNGGQNWLIEYNDLSYANTGITMYGQRINNNIIRYNHVHHMEGSRTGSGLGYARGYGIGFEGNILAGDTRIGNQIYGNVVHHCTGVAGGMQAFGISVKAADPSNYIYNNIVYNCSPNYLISNMQVQYVTQPTGGTFKNNISLEPNASSGAAYQKHVFVFANPSGYSKLTVDNNLYYPDDGTKFQIGSYACNFADWKTKLNASGITGCDTNSNVAAPLFSNASGALFFASDFKPASGSPAINKGDNSVWWGKPNLFDFSGSVAITDAAGTIIAPGGIVDIGAYEVSGAATTTTTNVSVAVPTTSDSTTTVTSSTDTRTKKVKIVRKIFNR